MITSCHCNLSYVWHTFLHSGVPLEGDEVFKHSFCYALTQTIIPPDEKGSEIWPHHRSLSWNSAGHMGNRHPSVWVSRLESSRRVPVRDSATMQEPLEYRIIKIVQHSLLFRGSYSPRAVVLKVWSRDPGLPKIPSGVHEITVICIILDVLCLVHSHCLMRAAEVFQRWHDVMMSLPWHVCACILCF